MTYDQAKAQVFDHVTPQVGEVRVIEGMAGHRHIVRVESFDEKWIILKTLSKSHPLNGYQHNLREWCDLVASGKYTKQ